MVAPVVLQPGAVFAADFRIERPLAEGGMGAVYVAEQQSTGKRRALKVMHPTLAPDEKSRARFVEEARVGARIESDHVVEVVAAGVDEATGVPWLAMELLEGQDLEHLVRARGALPPNEVLDLLGQVGHALGAAHRIGIIHRDLKPENLFLARSRRQHEVSVVKILDFGIARMVEGNQTAATVTSAIGSPLWMAPEQAQPGAKLRPATDVWALGLIAFYLLTGKIYWRAANHAQFNLSALLVEAMTHPIDPPSARARELGATLPPSFDAWFLRCVDRDPERRFADASEALAALRGALSAPGLAVAPTQPFDAQSGPGFGPTAPLPPAVAPRAEARPGVPIAVAAVALIGLLALLAAGVAGVGILWTASRRAPPQVAGQAPVAAEPAVVEEEEPVPAWVAEPEPEPAPVELPPAELAEEEPPAAPSRPPTRDVIQTRDSRTPRVRTGNADVRGSLSRDVIRRVIQRHQNEARYCYERGLVRNPQLAGRVTIRFIISPTGSVQAASVADSTLHAPDVESCLVTAARRWTFPAPEGGGVVVVNYPFVFSQG